MKPAVKERQCPSCGEGMPRDAGVCPSCQKESEPWQFFEGAWWTEQDGKWFWLDEKKGRWELTDDETVQETFNESPAGQARVAHELGHEFFQISLPLSTTEETGFGVISGYMKMTTTDADDHPDILQSIEREGWHLEHTGYVFHETGTVSRDKFIDTGQYASVTGSTLGIYLFRRAQKQEPK